MLIYAVKGTSFSLFIRDGRTWRLNDKAGENTGWLKAPVMRKEDQLRPPGNGWEFYSDSKWQVLLGS